MVVILKENNIWHDHTWYKVGMFTQFQRKKVANHVAGIEKAPKMSYWPSFNNIYESLLCATTRSPEDTAGVKKKLVFQWGDIQAVR